MTWRICFVISFLYLRAESSYHPSDKDFPDVREHYNHYPYPPVNAEEENSEEPPVNRGPTIGEINHFLHGGKLRRDRPYRIWVVGGGTGNSSLHYAHEFRHFDSLEIVHMDISEVALEIARQRADKRGYEIQFIHDSIYNSPSLNLGKFDFIDCVEVFHQLSDLESGLQILKKALKDESSGIYLSLHGSEGRKGINLMRKMIRLVNEDKEDISFQEELEVGLALYEALPLLHWVYYPNIVKIPTPDNASFYNKYIHKHDTSFTVNEAYEFIQSKGGLTLIDFADPNSRVILSLEPRNDPEFTELMAELTLEQRRDIHERIYSALSEINIFVSKDPQAFVKPEDTANIIPYFYNIDPSPIIQELSSQECGLESIRQFINVSLIMNSGESSMHWRNVIHSVSRNTLSFYELMTLRKYTVEDLLDKTIEMGSGRDREAMKKELLSFLDTLLLHGLIVYRHASVPDESFFNRQPSGVIESIRIINFELSIFASQWPHWLPDHGSNWPESVL